MSICAFLFRNPSRNHFLPHDLRKEKLVEKLGKTVTGSREIVELAAIVPAQIHTHSGDGEVQNTSGGVSLNSRLVALIEGNNLCHVSYSCRVCVVF